MALEGKSQHLLDARGLFCPEPVMMLHNKVREVAVGEAIRILATDPSTRRDIPRFCQFLGHELRESGTEQEGSVYFYVMVKKARQEEDR